MKALTILNPYPSLITLPESDPRHKRVENRAWWCSYRGPLLIHAGKSARLMDPDDPYRGLTFEWGKIVAICDLVDCVTLEWCDDRGALRVPPFYERMYPWLPSHPHTEGPNCLILANVRPLPTPVVCRGAQGLFNVPDLVAQRVRAQLQELMPV